MHSFSRNVKPMSKVEAFDPLCEVQSDKASVEITSPFDGVVKQLCVQEGEVAKVGEGLCLIEVDEEVAGELQATSPELVSSPEPSSSTPQPTPSASESRAYSSEGSEAKEMDDEQRRLHPMDPNRPPSVGTLAKPVGAVDILAAPSVRHFARHNSVDLALVAPGSGRSGRIEKPDIEAYLSRSSTSTNQNGSHESEVTVELGRTRYGMWKAMTKVSVKEILLFHTDMIEFRAWKFLISGMSLFLLPVHYLTSFPTAVTPRI